MAPREDGEPDSHTIRIGMVDYELGTTDGRAFLELMVSTAIRKAQELRAVGREAQAIRDLKTFAERIRKHQAVRASFPPELLSLLESQRQRLIACLQEQETTQPLDKETARRRIAEFLLGHGLSMYLQLNKIPRNLLQPFNDGEVVIPPGRAGGSPLVCRGVQHEKRLVIENRDVRK